MNLRKNSFFEKSKETNKDRKKKLNNAKIERKIEITQIKRKKKKKDAGEREREREREREI